MKQESPRFSHGECQQKIIQKIPKEALEKENLTEAEVLYYAENVKYTDDKLFRDVFASNTEVSNNLLKYFIGLLLEVEVVSVVINNSVFVTQRKNQKGACFELRPSIFLNRFCQEKCVNNFKNNSYSIVSCIATINMI